LAATATPQERPTEPVHPDVARRQAIERGLVYLSRQQAKDGAFGGRSTGAVGITSLSLLAFMAGGHQEDRGPFGSNVRRGVDYLVRRSLVRPSRGKPAGYIYLPGDSDSRMHGHGYATQVLVLAYGGSGDAARAAQLRDKIALAVRVIEESQTMTGGWGYEPNDRSFHEGSVTVTVVQALRLARDAGFVVDKGVHERGLKYLMDSQKRDGSFKYALLEPRSTAALTAAAITAMHGFGKYYGESIERGLAYLEQSYRDRDGHSWPFYANYYAAQAFYRKGGRAWRFWTREVVPTILAKQRRGAWSDDDLSHAPGTHGATYATAMSVLALAVPDGNLPLFQK
jgi:hypothetical protein